MADGSGKWGVGSREWGELGGRVLRSEPVGNSLAAAEAPGSSRAGGQDHDGGRLARPSRDGIVADAGRCLPARDGGESPRSTAAGRSSLCPSGNGMKRQATVRFFNSGEKKFRLAQSPAPTGRRKITGGRGSCRAFGRKDGNTPSGLGRSLALPDVNARIATSRTQSPSLPLACGRLR